MITDKYYKYIEHCCKVTGIGSDDTRIMPDLYHSVIEHVITLNEYASHPIYTDEHKSLITLYLDFRNWLLDRYFSHYDFDDHFNDVFSKANKKLWNRKDDYIKERLFFCRAFYEYLNRVGMDRKEFYTESGYYDGTLNDFGILAYKIKLCAAEYIASQVSHFESYQRVLYSKIIDNRTVRVRMFEDNSN